jgi:hypothetical protein
MFIPKGSIVYQNVYAMHRDEEIYSNPNVFDPDRYIPTGEGGKGEPFPYGNFGFGRRYVALFFGINPTLPYPKALFVITERYSVCPGQFLANNTIDMVMATVLATINIDWPVGESGKPTPFVPEWKKVGL